MKIKIQKKPKTKTTIRGNIILLSQVYFVAKICLRHVFLLVLWIFLAFVWLNSKICLFTIAHWLADQHDVFVDEVVVTSSTQQLISCLIIIVIILLSCFDFLSSDFLGTQFSSNPIEAARGWGMDPMGFKKTRKLKFVYQTVKPPHNNNND